MSTDNRFHITGIDRLTFGVMDLDEAREKAARRAARQAVLPKFAYQVVLRKLRGADATTATATHRERP